MNRHIFIDRLSVFIASLLAGKKKFFSESTDSPSFGELIGEIDFEMPAVRGEGTFELAVNYKGEPLSAAFRVEKWLGFEHPTIIYHHGNNERPFNYGKNAKNTFYNIFVRERDRFHTNLIVVRAPFHDLSLKEFREKMSKLENFMLMTGCSVKMNEAIIRRIREDSHAAVYTCGISLGGWVSNLHRALYNTATYYIPLLAGTCLAALFLESNYRKLTAKAAIEDAERLRKLLDFKDIFEGIRPGNVFPLLARYDQFVEYSVQEAGYRGMDLTILEAGHITAALNARMLRQHILNAIVLTEKEKGCQP